MNKFSLIFLVLASTFHSKPRPNNFQGSESINPRTVPGKTVYSRQSGSFPVKEINVARLRGNSSPSLFEYFISEDSFGDFMGPDHKINSLWIVIETMQIAAEISSVLDHKYDQSRKQLHKSYRMSINNLTHRGVIIGDDGHITCILEAKDKGGNWLPIEVPTGSGCYGALEPVTISQHQIAHTVVPIYEGPFKTQCRVRMGQNYSNAFAASINLNQFINKGM